MTEAQRDQVQTDQVGATTDPVTETRSGWWRRNRWALLALLPVVALVVAAGAGRALTLWAPLQLHDEISGEFGQFTTFTDDYRDAGGDHVRTAEVAVLRVTPDPEPRTRDGEVVPDVELPPGTRLWEVELGFEAHPDTVLLGCVVALVDEDGRITQRDSSLLTWATGMDDCQPVDTINPQAQLFVGDEPVESTRPPAYQRSVQLLTAADFEPAEVRVWWEAPTYLSVALPGQ